MDLSPDSSTTSLLVGGVASGRRRDPDTYTMGRWSHTKGLVSTAASVLALRVKTANTGVIVVTKYTMETSGQI